MLMWHKEGEERMVETSKQKTQIEAHHKITESATQTHTQKQTLLIIIHPSPWLAIKSLVIFSLVQCQLAPSAAVHATLFQHLCYGVMPHQTCLSNKITLVPRVHCDDSDSDVSAHFMSDRDRDRDRDCSHPPNQGFQNSQPRLHAPRLHGDGHGHGHGSRSRDIYFMQVHCRCHLRQAFRSSYFSKFITNTCAKHNR